MGGLDLFGGLGMDPEAAGCHWRLVRQCPISLRFPILVGHRKRVKHCHEPGDCHELTFSCYRRLPLLANDARCRTLCDVIGRALQRNEFRLVAFVLMPEDVHLLVCPTLAGLHWRTSRQWHPKFIPRPPNKSKPPIHSGYTLHKIVRGAGWHGQLVCPCFVWPGQSGKREVRSQESEARIRNPQRVAGAKRSVPHRHQV